MVAGQGAVQPEVVSEPPPSRTEAEAPAPLRLLGEMSATPFRWDCQKNGHVFVEGQCNYCHRGPPLNPATPLLVSLVMWAAIFALLSQLAGCGCSAEVIDATPLADGGYQLGARYCAQECVTTADCAAGWHCSLHPWDPMGICFRDHTDGGVP
jgi:hypothetical protein